MAGGSSRNEDEVAGSSQSTENRAEEKIKESIPDQLEQKSNLEGKYFPDIPKGPGENPSLDNSAADSISDKKRNLANPNLPFRESSDDALIPAPLTVAKSGDERSLLAVHDENVSNHRYLQSSLEPPQTGGSSFEHSESDQSSSQVSTTTKQSEEKEGQSEARKAKNSAKKIQENKNTDTTSLEQSNSSAPLVSQDKSSKGIRRSSESQPPPPNVDTAKEYPQAPCVAAFINEPLKLKQHWDGDDEVRSEGINRVVPLNSSFILPPRNSKIIGASQDEIDAQAWREAQNDKNDSEVNEADLGEKEKEQIILHDRIKALKSTANQKVCR